MTAQRRALVINRLLVRQERLMQRDIAGHFAKLATEIQQRYSQARPDAVLAVIDAIEQDFAEILERRMVQTAQLFGENTFDHLTDIAKSYYPGVAWDTGPVNDPDASAMVEQSSPFFDPLWLFTQAKETQGFRDVFNATIRSYFQLHAASRVVSVDATLKGQLRSILEAAAAEQLGEAATAKKIAEELRGPITRTNAARIARTEAHTAANVGADEAARSTGLEMVKEWAAAEDDRTRPSHANADGQVVGMDERFQVGKDELMFPGDPAGSAKEIINCRCAVLHLPVIDGEILR